MLPQHKTSQIKQPTHKTGTVTKLGNNTGETLAELIHKDVL
ncbi:MAG: hypothetical protein AAGI66_08250 [Cyanobacteria bacterium P01_H01_bin.74]